MEEYFDIEEEDYDLKKEDEYIEIVCVVNWDSPPIYDDYLEDYSQGDKIELDENKIIYIRGEPITSERTRPTPHRCSLLGLFSSYLCRYSFE